MSLCLDRGWKREKWRWHTVYVQPDAFSQKIYIFSVWTMELNSLRSQHDRFTRATSDKRTKSGKNPRYSFGLQTVYLLGPEPWAALDPATPLYTALGDTVKKVDEFTAESITSLSNLVRSIQIDFPSLTTCQKLLIPQERYNVTF